MKRTLLLILAVAACGPPPKAAPIPLLPGDGDQHVAKPATPVKDTNDLWAGKTDLIAPPPAAAPSAVALPPLDEWKLANGLAVHVVRTERAPVVSVQLAIRAGRMHEPRARLGVSELAADMLVRGTRKRDANAIARSVDAIGASLAADATFEATLVSCGALAKQLGTCLDLVNELVTQPTFPDGEIAKVRDRIVKLVGARLTDPSGLAAAHVQNLLWGADHVRGWVNSEQSVGALRRDDLLAWHKQWFHPNNALLVVTGDVDPKRIRAEIERAFGGWAKTPVAQPPPFKEAGLSGSRIRLVDAPGATTAHVRVAQYGIKHQDPHFFDALVWNHALGGGAIGSRLSRVRIGERLYSATTSFDRNVDRGSFVATAVTRSPDAVAMAKAIVDALARMEKDGPTQEEVNAAIASITGGYGIRFQTAAELGSALLGAELHDFGREYLTNFPLAVGKVDVESAKRAAGEILDAKAYVVVIVGDAKDLEPALKKEGWRFQKVSFADAISPPAVEAWDPKSVAEARRLVDEALAAKGGKAKLAALKGLHMVQSGTTAGRDGTQKLDIDRTIIFPDKMRIDASVNGNKVVIALDGKTGWQLAPTEVDDQGKPGKVQLGEIDSNPTIEFERWREPDVILLRASDPAAQITIAADESIDGNAVSVVRMRSPFQGVEVFLYIDKKTKLIRRMLYNDHGRSEADDFDDYKVVGGLQIAHKRTSNNNGRVTRLEVKSIELDPKFDPKAWVKPTVP
ncbi:MAG: insulinase family protein [Deltaproteobacteria bacterium]|nr:insulinase family protein [Deltaproteobacteria bacterium]MCW5806153.1 insulinase family protein [Deltaproteobacteria bacterium]